MHASSSQSDGGGFSTNWLRPRDALKALLRPGTNIMFFGQIKQQRKLTDILAIDKKCLANPPGHGLDHFIA